MIAWHEQKLVFLFSTETTKYKIYKYFTHYSQTNLNSTYIHQKELFIISAPKEEEGEQEERQKENEDAIHY